MRIENGAPGVSTPRDCGGAIVSLMNVWLCVPPGRAPLAVNIAKRLTSAATAPKSWTRTWNRSTRASAAASGRGANSDVER